MSLHYHFHHGREDTLKQDMTYLNECWVKDAEEDLLVASVRNINVVDKSN